MQRLNLSHILGLGTFDGIPRKELFRRVVKMQIVATLVWDYTDTVLDLASQMRLSDTKRLSRAVKTLRNEYHRRAAESLDKAHIDKTAELAMLFEAINRDNFDRLFQSLRIETRSRDNLHPGFETLVEAVQMALTVLDALWMYCRQCDAYIRKYFPDAEDSIMSPELRKLSMLLPGFAGDGYDCDSQARGVMAKILLDEINRIELYDDNGKV